jgi:UDP-N-acetyl-D-mannosaminuronic acid dehydrogenase
MTQQHDTYDLTILGLGYIGLPTAALAAQAGLNVLGVDIQDHIIDAVNAGNTHLEEPGLSEIVKTVVDSGKLRAAHTPAPSDIFMIAVPTPVDHDTHKPDMSLVQTAARTIATVAAENNLIILQSTSPVGSTINNVKHVIEGERPDLIDKLHYIYCPERAIPGKTMVEMVENDRSVGGLTDEATKQGLAFYKHFVTGKLIPTSAGVAEMVKLVENASRDVQIAFANELSLVCDHMGLDVWEVIDLANLHPRVNILNPGPGVGGHCIAVDPWFIIDAAPDVSPLMRSARAVNDGKPDWVIQKIQKAAAQTGKSRPVICALGLAYKENVDDFRESPSVTIVDQLIAQNIGELIVIEPYMDESDKYTLLNLDDALPRTDIIVHLTPHDAFKTITPAQLDGKILIDTRGNGLGT